MNPPAHAVTIWLDGDRIMCQFPDRQLVHFVHAAQLIAVLQARQRKRDHRVATEASPVQYDIDTVAEALARQQHSEEWDARVRDAGIRRRERDEQVKVRRIKRDSKEMKELEARRWVREAGL
jgi:hypothetical protein